MNWSTAADFKTVFSVLPYDLTQCSVLRLGARRWDEIVTQLEPECKGLYGPPAIQTLRKPEWQCLADG